jgi:hypothetical protein
MTFQAYLDTIKAKTGLGPDDFRKLADARGLLAADVKTSTILAWLKADFDLGPGHGMAIVSTFKELPADSDRLEAQFAGAKAKWRAPYESLLGSLAKIGPVDVSPTDTYNSLLKGKAKFGIVAFTTDRMDVGIKLKSAAPTDRFAAAGNWNSMVTHRVRVTDPAQIDAELLGWLGRAYDAA